ncbi:metal ABC transporter permease, partial [Akkermansiaceae bacterium]|nr:metal ABC transporter permease [Akkermansiaceae bacterium]
MTWTENDTGIMLVGILCAMACALPGCFLLLRRMSMMGDAISHAVLPGLAIAFLISHSRASWAMFVGAAIAGILTALFTQWITKFGKVDRGAAMGIVFTTLFAIGLILIKQTADHVDLDASCVLYGAIEHTPLDSVTLWENATSVLRVPRAALVVGGALL